jgi:hypothetical protein
MPANDRNCRHLRLRSAALCIFIAASSPTAWQSSEDDLAQAV